MPPLIFDFPDIASRLRKDDFYTPTPKHVAVDLGRPQCPRCNSTDIATSLIAKNGYWYCNACNWYFS